MQIHSYGYHAPTQGFSFATGTFLIHIDGKPLVMMWHDQKQPLPPQWQDYPRLRIFSDSTLTWSWDEKYQATSIILAKDSYATRVEPSDEITARLGREYKYTTQKPVASLAMLTRLLGEAGYLPETAEIEWVLEPTKLPEEDPGYQNLCEWLSSLPYESVVIWKTPYWRAERPYHQGPWVEIKLSPWCQEAGENWAFLVGSEAERAVDHNHPRIMISLPQTPATKSHLDNKKIPEGIISPSEKWVYLPRQINHLLKVWAQKHLGRSDLVFKWMPESIPVEETELHAHLYESLGSGPADKTQLDLPQGFLESLGALE